MDINIEITNMDKHFFFNSNKRENLENQDKTKKYKTKLTHYCFYAINEATISKKIKNIRYYSNYYIILEDYEFINISQLNDKILEKLDLEDEKKYLIFKYKNDKLIKFNDFMLNIHNPKLFILHTIESFSYLLRSLIILHENNMCFFNLSPQNIVFNMDCGEKPLIQNFRLSLQVSKLNEEYITNIIDNDNDYTHKPLEVHILFYLIKNNISTISYSFIEQVCEVFINNLSILTLFSENYKESYKLSCIEYLKKYINKPKTEIIFDILEQNNTWDVYSISFLYLHIFGNISRVFSLKRNFLSKIITELTKNISPDPSKRSSLKSLLENFETYLTYEKDWSFVNTLSANKMSQLIEILGK